MSVIVGSLTASPGGYGLGFATCPQAGIRAVWAGQGSMFIRARRRALGAPPGGPLRVAGLLFNIKKKLKKYLFNIKITA